MTLDNRTLRREAILHQSSVNALNKEIRKFGKDLKTDRQAKQLKSDLLEFLDIIIEKYQLK